ncbi:MAG: flagellar biosynthesis protein FlhB [Deltaproteobacteria bacterium]|nr:flagellar biosynthesis protein FlhB [Deltaproteobacteria bacterium]
MAEDAANKTEEPTPKRREEARTEGKVPQSVEVTAAAVLLAAVVVTTNRGPAILNALREMMRRSLLAASATDFTPALMSEVMRRMAGDSVAIAWPILAVTGAVGLTVTVAQVGFQILPKRILPDASKISPATGLSRIVSKRGAVEILKALLKIALVGWITWDLLRAVQDQIVPLASSGPREILAVAGHELGRVVAWTTAAISVLAAFDYAWQRRQHQMSLRMSRGEVKDERRQAEGDPQMKQRVKRAYQQIARRRMLDAVPSADVVVTNPVHLAVALRYAPGEMGAPVVVAKGAEHVAERIKEIARRSGVPVLERRALARALFRAVPIGGQIPGSLYRAVAEILAYIYALKQRRAS